MANPPSPGHHPAMSRPSPALRTQRLCLRPVAASDADTLHALHSSPRILRYWDSPPWTDRDQADRFVARCVEIEREGSGVRCAIERADDGGFIGWCGLVQWNRTYRSAKLGYLLADTAWGRGYATEAVGALLGWAFGASDLNRVQAEVDTRNGASARVLEKLGFRLEGTLRQDCIVDGEISDSWVFGLLRADREQGGG